MFNRVIEKTRKNEKKGKKNALNENSCRQNARKKNLFGIPRLIYKAI